MYKEYLIAFKDLQITKKELLRKLGIANLTKATTNEPLVIYTSDVIALLNAYASGKITCDQLIDWVNTVWFTDLFDYDDDQSDSIASVMSLLEELDEEDRKLTKSDIDIYISALEKNQEI